MRIPFRTTCLIFFLAKAPQCCSITGCSAFGRVILPETLRNLAGIKDEATFVGMGQRFQVWEPKAYDEYYAKALEEAQRNRDLLRAPAAQSGNGSVRTSELRSGKDGGCSITRFPPSPPLLQKWRYAVVQIR